MRKLGIALLVLLVASSAAVPTRAPAAPLFPSLLAPGARQGQYLRVQYGGGDDDDGPSYSQPQHSHQHSNYNCCGGGGGGGGAAIAGLIAGVATMAIRESIRQKQVNDYRQQQQTYQIQTQRQQQARKQNQRNEAAQRRRNNEEKARQKREDALANEERQEKVDALNQQKRELEQLKKDIENQKAEQNKPAGYPSDDNNPAGNTETRTDTYENQTDIKGNVVINIIPSRPSDPDPGTLKVGPVTLYPSHIDVPPDRTICTGTTAKGCFLRIVTTPSAAGGSRQECILYCKSDPRPRPVPPPRPIPTPAVVVTPTPTPTPIKRTYHAELTVIAEETVVPKRQGKPAVKTVIAEDYVEPKRQGKPAVKTVIAEDYVEPKPKPKPAVKTVIAEDYVEPKPKPKPAVKTVIAEDYVGPKRQGKPAVKTVIAEDYVEPKRQGKPAVKTVIAEDYVEPKRQPKPAEKTVIATEQKITDNKITNNKTSNNKITDDKPAGDGGQLDEAEIINPVECPNLNLGACGARFKKQQEDAEKKRQQEEKIARDEKKKRDDEIARKKKEDEENRYALEHPGDPDSKGCTKNGDIPIAALLADPDYQRLLTGSSGIVPVSTESGLEKIHARDILTTGLKAVPEVGSVLSGVTSFLWKDPKPDRLFDELVTYVKQLVPELITAERVGQQNFDVAGLRLLLQAYQAEGNLVEKGKKLDYLQNRLRELEPAYLNNPDTPPEKVLPLVIAYGRLRLAVVRERLLHQKEYYPDNVSTLLVPDYNDTVKALGDAAKDIKQKIIDNRLAKLHSDHDMRTDYDKPIWGTGGFLNTSWYTAGDDFCDWHFEHKDDENAAKADLAARTDAVRKAYNRELDVLLAPITNWPSITPVAQPAKANGEPLAELDAVSDYLPKDDGKSMGTFAKEVLDNYKLAFAKSCDRHFKNESNDVTWEVRGSEGSGVCEPAACVVKPHQTITVHYPVIENSFRFTISSNGTGGNAYHDDFEVKQGNVIETGNCAYIKHDGRTGLAKLNDGANGDITFLNGDAAHRLARRRESLKKITNIAMRRWCEKHLATCSRVHDD